MPRPAPTSPVSSAGPHPSRSRQMVGRASGPTSSRTARTRVPQPRRWAPHRAARATPPTALPSWSASQVPVVAAMAALARVRYDRGRPAPPWQARTWPSTRGHAHRLGVARRVVAGQGHPQPLAAVQPCQGVHALPDGPDLRRMTQAHQAPEGDRAHPGQASARGSPTSAARTHTHTNTSERSDQNVAFDRPSTSSAAPGVWLAAGAESGGAEDVCGAGEPVEVFFQLAQTEGASSSSSPRPRPPSSWSRAGGTIPGGT